MTAADREAALRSALAALQERLARAAESAGRPVDDIELLPITKFFPASDVAILWRLGCRSFGESREQEASAKIAELAGLVPEAAPHWHMVGQVQRNKAKAIVAWADSVHSLSSTRVAAALNRAAGQGIADGGRDKPLGVFVQISLDGDTSRGGVDIGNSAAVDELCDYAAASDGLRLLGLMAVPPLGTDPDEAFSRLAAEHRRVQKSHPTATRLSAGMSGDLEIAVRHGSTCVRVGTAVMGQRPLTSP
jgi:pyridoxal phosphate enzyme (YggS family)